MIALLFAGSAIMLMSCGKKQAPVEEANDESLLTHQADSLLIIRSENGRKSFRFQTPLMETYDYAREPFREFRKGIKIETYTKDSIPVIESTLIADYAVEFPKRKLWRAEGNVVATNAEGQVLETQQLFWDERTDKVYSNVDSKITQGGDVIVGVGFESDSKMKDWVFLDVKGQVEVDTEPKRDSTAVASGGAEALPAVSAE